ncbi:hypothetical protein ACFU8W_41220 [Streptomyces sp. NPDC057565]|uniref:hypothetical protein n=1 Tax=Streptomyces sp. NPDC057565 TaxID=3346169 RepID=UPI00367DC82A
MRGPLVDESGPNCGPLPTRADTARTHPLATAVNPLLAPVGATMSFLVEGWADESPT